MPRIADAHEPVAIFGPGFGSALLKHHTYAELLTVASERLLMALPVEKRRGHDRALATQVTPSTLPQVSRAMTHEAVLAFLNKQKRPFRFTSLPEDSSFFKALKSDAVHFKFVQRWQRACLRINGTYEQWLNQFDTKRRKEWKRQRNRLSELGVFEVVRLENLKAAIDGYLALEAKGWKGRAGTALKASEADAALFNEICHNLAATGALRVWSLKLDGRCIASLVGIVEGEQAWIFKIAYDEDYAKFSPGVLVVLQATRDFFADGTIKLVDSCAIPGHPMIDRLWKDRIAFADVLVAPQRVSWARFAATYVAIVGVQVARQKLKPLYLRLKGRKLS